MQLSENQIKCEICNKVYTKKGLKYHLTHSHKIEAEVYYKKYLLKENENICEMYGQLSSCKKYSKFISLSEGYRIYCSIKCMSNDKEIKIKKEQTCLKNYGETCVLKNESIKNKIKQTCLKKYGKEHHLQTKECLDNLKQTNLKRYGVENISQLELTKQKKKETCLKNYGVENPIQSPEVKEKFVNTFQKKYKVTNPAQLKIIQKRKIQNSLKKYGVNHPSQLPEVKNKFTQTRYKNFIPKLVHMLKKFNVELIGKYKNSDNEHEWKCQLCSTIFKSTWKNMINGSNKWRCPNCFPYTPNLSKPEKEVAEFIMDILPNTKIIENDKSTIKSQYKNYPAELDIYIPEKKIAIEFNGLYWHSEQYKNKNYHLYKTEECKKLGIRLIHIFGDEWLFKSNIVKSRLKQILGVNKSKRIHGRKCIIKEIEPSIKNKFLEEYHIQGKDSSRIKLGAFYEDKLISVMTFSKGSISKGSKNIKKEWELNRFCSNSNYHIPGIASKLLTYFKRNYEWNKIYSYADLRWSNGNVYKQLNFILKHKNKPNYWYTDGLDRYHRFGFRKRPDEPKDIPEWFLRQLEGYDRIWDCGTLKFEIKQ